MDTSLAHPADCIVALPAAVTALADALGDNLWAVILYGSVARGEAGPESDVDLYLIFEELPDHPLDRDVWFRQQRPEGWPPGASARLVARAEFEQGFPSLYLDLGLDGQVLWERAGYATTQLDRIRELIEEAGLYRMRLSPGNFYWTWKRPPAPGRWRIDWTGVYGVPR